MAEGFLLTSPKKEQSSIYLTRIKGCNCSVSRFNLLPVKTQSDAGGNSVAMTAPDVFV